jgi:hypothetical protein
MGFAYAYRISVEEAALASALGVSAPVKNEANFAGLGRSR